MDEREFSQFMDNLFRSTGIPKQYFDLPFDPIKPEKYFNRFNFIEK